MNSVSTEGVNALAEQYKLSLWQRLQRLDKILILVLMPIWFTCLILHIDLALDDQLVRPAILFEKPSTVDGYPLVAEVLTEAQSIVAEQGIRVGDQILSINDRSLQGLSGYRAGIIAASFLGRADEISATFRRGQETFTREYPFNDFGIPRWWPSLFAISFGAVGLLVLLSAPQSPTARAIFPAFIFFSLSWLVILGNSEIQTIMSTVVFGVSMIFAGPLVLRAILLLPENTAIKSKVVHRGVWIFSLMVLSGLSAFTGQPFSTGVGQVMHAAFMALFYLSILLILTRNYIKANNVGRRQLRWVILGFYFAFVPAMIVTAIVIIFPQKFSLYALSSIGMPIVPIMFLVAITQYNLFDIDRLIGGSISYSLLIILIALITEAVIEPLVAVTGSTYGFDGDTVQLVFVGSLTALLIPLQRRWRRSVNRVLFAQGAAVEAGVTELVETIEQQQDMSSDEINRLVGEALSKIYKLNQWGIFQIREGVLILINGVFNDDIPELVWRKYEKRSRPGTETISADKACLIAPIRPHGEPSSLLILGPKGSGDVYTTTDNGLISTLTLEIADKQQTD